MAHKFLNFALVEYSLIKYEPSTLAAGALYLSHVLEKRRMQKKAHQNSAHSLGSSHGKSRDYSTDLSSILLVKLSKDADITENEIKK